MSTPLGRTLFLPCVVVASNNSATAVTVAWQHNGAPFDPTPHVRIHTPVVMQKSGVTVIKSVLELCLTTTEAGGEYGCRAMAAGEILDEEIFHITAKPQSKLDWGSRHGGRHS